MPALSTEVTNFLNAVTDKLKYGQNTGARASLSLGTGANGTVKLTANAPGTAGNAWTVAVAVGGGTAPLSVGVSGTAITITLATNTGTPVTASNTAALIAAALNANATIAAVFTATASGTGGSSLSAAVTATAVSGGVAVDSNSAVLGVNYLRAQDTATVLELFQDAISKSSVITATAGSTTTATIAAASTANALKGAKVTFAANTTTTALRGVTATVKSNTTTVITFVETLPAAVANTDTFTIQQTIMDSAITELRGAGKSKGDAPAGNVFGLNRTVLDALSRLCGQLGGSLASRTVSGPTILVGTGSTKSAIVLNQNVRVDEFKGLSITISGETRKIIGNTETTILVSKDFTSAPAATTAVSIFINPVAPAPNNYGDVLPGGQPGDNATLALNIAAAQALVVAYVLPA